MLLIRNAHLMTMEDKDYPRGDVLIDKGRIAAVGNDLPVPEGAEIVDAHGLTLTPGIIDAHCHIGMAEDGLGWEGEDSNEMTDPVTPQLRGIDGFNPRDVAFSEAVEGGVTAAATGPGSANVIGGQFLLTHTGGASTGCAEDWVLQAPLALKTAYGENPKRCYGINAKRSPQTRMATAALMRQAFSDARAYMQKRADPDESKRPPLDLGKEVLAQALRGELLVKAHAHRADDIVTAMRVAREFGFRLSLEHCTEGWTIPEALLAEQKRTGMPVILGPLFHARSKIECMNRSMRAPAVLAAHGVRFAIMTDHPVIPIQYLPVQLSLAVREGLDARAAYRAITLDAAWAIGWDKDMGSIRVGKRADLALHDGDPLDVRTRVKRTWIDGETVFEG